MSTLFVDPVFPPEASSLAYDPEYQKPEFLASVKSWKRPREWAPNSQLFVDSTNPGDIEQGALGDCWLLSSMSVVASYPAILKKLFVEADPKIGKYTVRLYQDSEWQNVTVDDRIPCGADGLPAFGHNTMKNEIWVVILEKAIAKFYGCYEALNGGYLEEGVVLLTGGRPERIYVNNWKEKLGKVQLRKEKLWEKLVAYCNDNVMMGCSISNGKEERDQARGLVAGHAYGVLDVKETADKKNKLLKIRNPWGCFEWKGDWSDNSRKWTPQYRKELGAVSKDDGVFWMAFQDFCTIFDKISCCRIFNDTLLKSKNAKGVPLDQKDLSLTLPHAKWFRMKYQGAWNDTNSGGLTSTKLAFSKNPHLKLTISKPGRYFLLVSRASIDQNVEAQYYRSSIGFVIHKGLSSNYKEVPTENSDNAFLMYPNCARFTSVEMELDADDYVITPCTLYPNRKGNFLFEAYGDSQFGLVPLEDSQYVFREAPPSSRGAGELESDPSQMIVQKTANLSLNNSARSNSSAKFQPGATSSQPAQGQQSKFMTTYQYEFSRRKLL